MSGRTQHKCDGSCRHCQVDKLCLTKSKSNMLTGVKRPCSWLYVRGPLTCSMLYTLSLSQHPHQYFTGLPSLPTPFSAELVALSSQPWHAPKHLKHSSSRAHSEAALMSNTLSMRSRSESLSKLGMRETTNGH